MSIIPRPLRSIIPSKDIVQPVVLVLTLAWAIYTFAWKEYISGQYAPPKLKIETSLQLIKRTKDYQLARVQFTARNSGDQALYLMSDLWKIAELDHKIIPEDKRSQEFDARLSRFLKSGSDADWVERIRKVSNGVVLAAGSLGWNSLYPSESQRLSQVIALPPTSREIVLTIIVPYSKNLNRDSNTWINWKYDKKAYTFATEICIPSRKGVANQWQCEAAGSKEYQRQIKENSIRFAYDESAYLL